jgi:hypothetical protein
MNEGLKFYNDNHEIMSISGYNLSPSCMNFPKNFTDDVYLNYRNSRGAGLPGPTGDIPGAIAIHLFGRWGPVVDPVAQVKPDHRIADAGQHQGLSATSLNYSKTFILINKYFKLLYNHLTFNITSYRHFSDN